MCTHMWLHLRCVRYVLKCAIVSRTLTLENASNNDNNNKSQKFGNGRITNLNSHPMSARNVTKSADERVFNERVARTTWYIRLPLLLPPSGICMYVCICTVYTVQLSVCAIKLGSFAAFGSTAADASLPATHSPHTLSVAPVAKSTLRATAQRCPYPSFVLLGRQVGGRMWVCACVCVCVYMNVLIAYVNRTAHWLRVAFVTAFVTAVSDFFVHVLST